MRTKYIRTLCIATHPQAWSRKFNEKLAGPFMAVEAPR